MSLPQLKPPFLAIHIGAGFIKKKNEESYKKLINKSLIEGMKTLQSKNDSGCRLLAEEAVIAAVRVLEESGQVNCGNGSNLTIDGSVECDATCMYSCNLHKVQQEKTESCKRKRHFASVGAVPGVVSPVSLCGKVAESSQAGLLPHGLIPPRVLVGEGARQWARDNGAEDLLTSPANMVCTSALQKWSRYLSMVSPRQSRKRQRRAATNSFASKEDLESNDWLQSCETVGAVCVDSNGHIATAVSSGGIHLKPAGRIGHAATYGAGCWITDDADNTDSNKAKYICAASSSGCGEGLIETLFARTISQKAASSVPTNPGIRSLLDKVLRRYPPGSSYSKAGVIILHYNTDSADVHFSWAYNTKVFALGYISGNDPEPTSIISRQDVG